VLLSNGRLEPKRIRWGKHGRPRKGKNPCPPENPATTITTAPKPLAAIENEGIKWRPKRKEQREMFQRKNKSAE